MHLRPDPLKSKDKVAIVATARKVDRKDLTKAVEILESWGLKVVLGNNLFAEHHQFAGDDDLRLIDFQQMINDPEIKAIICARGGYGTTRIVDAIDFSPLLRSPKWIVGFSDITVLLFQLFKLNVESVHGIMAGLFHKKGVGDSIESLRRILFGDPVDFSVSPHAFNKTGMGEGELIGGNLSIVNNIIGTDSDINMDGKILFLEDLDEYLYHVDRMMVHLKRAGKIQRLAGLIVGDMSDMNDNPVSFGSTAYEIIRDHIAEFSYPVAFGFPIGHEAVNLAVPCGRNAILEVGTEKAKLHFKE